MIQLSLAKNTYKSEYATRGNSLKLLIKELSLRPEEVFI